MTMTISSKSFIKSISFLPSPQTPHSTKPQTSNHIPFSISFKPILQINHTHQQSLIPTLQSYPIQKNPIFSTFLPPSNQESSISTLPSTLTQKNPNFSPILPPSNQESSIPIQKNPNFSPTLTPKSLPIEKDSNFSSTLYPKSIPSEKNPSFSSTYYPKSLLIEKKSNFSSTLCPKSILIEKDPNFSSTFCLESLSIACPAFAYANSLFFKSAYNVQVVGYDNEPEDRLIGRFRNAVMRAKVLQEARRRRFFETNQDKRKRKTRDALKEAARRNRKRRDPPKDLKQGEKEQPKDEYNFRDDNWELTDVKVPYC